MRSVVFRKSHLRLSFSVAVYIPSSNFRSAAGADSRLVIFFFSHWKVIEVRVINVVISGIDIYSRGIKISNRALRQDSDFICDVISRENENNRCALIIVHDGGWNERYHLSLSLVDISPRIAKPNVRSIYSTILQSLLSFRLTRHQLSANGMFT